MKKVLLFTVYILLSLNKLFAQTDCVNLDFEDGTFATWTGYTGIAGFPIVAVGFEADRHTIISQQGLDPITNNTLFKRSPFGGNFSVRLGNENVGSEAESLSRQFQVTEESNSILLSYAVVFEDPGHDPTEQPKFRMEVLDASGLESTILVSTIQLLQQVIYQDFQLQTKVYCIEIGHLLQST